MRFLTRPTLTAALVATAAVAAFAAVKVQFFTATCVGDQLEANFKVTGLGQVERAEFKVVATAQVTVVCINRGGNEPPGQIKTTTTVTEKGVFPVSSGQVTGKLVTVAPDPAQFQHQCPKGFVAERVDVVKFTNIQLIGPGGKVLATAPDVTCD